MVGVADIRSMARLLKTTQYKANAVIRHCSCVRYDVTSKAVVKASELYVE